MNTPSRVEEHAGWRSQTTLTTSDGGGFLCPCLRELAASVRDGGGHTADWACTVSKRALVAEWSDTLVRGHTRP